MKIDPLMTKVIQRVKEEIINIIYFFINRLIAKRENYILFIPHINSSIDNYDILNPDSDNVLTLFNSILKDEKLKKLHLFLGYYNEDKLDEYRAYCQKNSIHVVSYYNVSNILDLYNAFCKCNLIFTDETFRDYPLKTKSQKVVCLNYYAGFMKNDFFRIKEHGGFKHLLKEQKRMKKYYDFVLSTSDLSCMFLTVEDCVYYGNTLPLGFPRNDIFYQDNSALRKRIHETVGFDFDHIITYVPTHRDYENIEREEFYNEEDCKPRTLFGSISKDEFELIEQTLEATNSIVLAKVHPMQVRDNIIQNSSMRIIYYHNLVKTVTTSLNPILAITDCLITDYTTAVYDFAHANKPIIYYFYDIEKYVGTRGLFINPIDPICMGNITYSVKDLCSQILEFAAGVDKYKDKRSVISDLLIRNRDGNSKERVKKYFLRELYS